MCSKNSNHVQKRELVKLTRKYMILVDLIKNYNDNVTETEDKIPGLIAITALNTVKNKILYIFNLLKKLSDVEAKYFTTFDQNEFAGEILDQKIKKMVYLINPSFLGLETLI